MNREFSFDRTYFQYSKTYIKSFLIGSLVFVVLAGVFNGGTVYKDMVFWSILISFPVVTFLSSFLIFLEVKNLKYIFSDNSVSVVRNNKIETFNLSEIEDITKPSKLKRLLGWGSIKIKFQKGKELKLDNSLPYFENLRIFLEQHFEENPN